MIVIDGKHYTSRWSLLDAVPEDQRGGFFERTGNGVRLYGMDGEPFAFVVNNRHNEQFIVTCSRRSDRRIWYMHALTDQDAKRLGIPDNGCLQGYDLARNIIAQAADNT